MCSTAKAHGPLPRVARAADLRRQTTPYARPVSSHAGRSHSVDGAGAVELDDLLTEVPGMSCATALPAAPPRPGSAGPILPGIKLQRSGLSGLAGTMSIDPPPDPAILAAASAAGVQAASAHPPSAFPVVESAAAAAASPTTPPPPLSSAPSCETAPCSSSSSTSASFTRSRGEALLQAALEGLTWGVAADKGGCGFQEDASSVHQQPATLGLFGVYDGHNGSAAANLLREQLHARVLAALGSGGGGGEGSRGRDDAAARAALTEGFRQCEADLLGARSEAGATAVVLLMLSGGRDLHVAWVGGCRAIPSPSPWP